MRHRDPSNRRRGEVAVLAALAFVAIAGCGGDDDDAGSDPADVEASDAGDVGGDGGDGSSDSGGDAGDSGGASDSGGSVDAGGGDFPIPAPDGLLVDALVDAGINIEGQRQLYYPNDDFDRVVGFYDEWTGRNGEWARTEASGMVLYQALDSDGIRTINIQPDQDAGAQADGPVTFVVLVAG